MTPARLGLLAAVLVFAADQASKWAVLEGLGLREGGGIRVTPFMDLTLVWNRGVSYGLLRQDTGAGRWVLTGVALIAAAGLVAWITRAGTRVLALALGLVAGGALGNALDRMVHGAVVDFVHLHAGGWSWYVFNAADAAIVAGVALLLYDSLWPGRNDPAISSPPSSPTRADA